MGTAKPRGKITIELPEALLAEMRAMAEAHRRSLTGEIEWALQHYLIAVDRAIDTLGLMKRPPEGHQEGGGK